MPKKREEIYLSAFWSDMRRKLFKVDEILFFDLFCSDIFCSSSIILVCPGRSSLSQWVGHKIQRIGAFGISKWILLYSVLVWLISNFKIFFLLCTSTYGMFICILFHSSLCLQKGFPHLSTSLYYLLFILFVCLYYSVFLICLQKRFPHLKSWTHFTTADLSLALKVCTFAICKSTQCIFSYCLSIHTSYLSLSFTCLLK